MSIEHELKHLFGHEIAQQSKQLTEDDLVIEVELVAEGARQLKRALHNPIRQREIVRCMATDTALALCQWLRKPDLMNDFHLI